MPELSLAIVGPGLVGKALLKQLKSQAGKLEGALGAGLRVCGVANSRTMLLSDPSHKEGLDPKTWQRDLEQGEPSDIGAFLDRARHNGSNTVLVDCSASPAVASSYARFISEGGGSVVTPNKRLGAGPLADYMAVKQACRQSGGQFYYEATVGAGLPIISTLQGLVATGDGVKRIEGVLSGTLSFIFNTFGPGRSFSSVVTEAKSAGYTEPDPREDLSGTDVARKVVILARECGLQVELADVEVESLVPAALQDSPTADDFLARLPEFDAEWEERASKAASKGQKLCYVGQVDLEAGKCSVALQSYPASHAFAQLQGSDNIVSFQTTRYHSQQLFIRGPGAGAEVTAAGVFSDLLLLARSLGARF